MTSIFQVRITCPTWQDAGKTAETLNSEAISQKIVFETDCSWLILACVTDELNPGMMTVLVKLSSIGTFSVSFSEAISGKFVNFYPDESVDIKSKVLCMWSALLHWCAASVIWEMFFLQIFPRITHKED